MQCCLQMFMNQTTKHCLYRVECTDNTGKQGEKIDQKNCIAYFIILAPTGLSLYIILLFCIEKNGYKREGPASKYKLLVLPNNSNLAFLISCLFLYVVQPDCNVSYIHIPNSSSLQRLLSLRCQCVYLLCNVYFTTS